MEAESLTTLLDLLDKYSQAINALSNVVHLHRSILEWSETLTTAEEVIRKETDESKVILEVNKVMEVYHDYVNTFENFQSKVELLFTLKNLWSNLNQWLGYQGWSLLDLYRVLALMCCICQ